MHRRTGTQVSCFPAHHFHAMWKEIAKLRAKQIEELLRGRGLAWGDGRPREPAGREPARRVGPSKEQRWRLEEAVASSSRNRVWKEDVKGRMNGGKMRQKLLKTKEDKDPQGRLGGLMGRERRADKIRRRTSHREERGEGRELRAVRAGCFRRETAKVRPKGRRRWGRRCDWVHKR